METYRIYLNPQERKHKWSPYYFIIMGVVYLFLGFVNYFLNTKLYHTGLIWIFGGVLFLFGGYYQTNFSSKYFLELNENLILLKDSISKTKSFSWNNIEKIQVKPIAIEFLLNNGSKESLSLGYLGYSNVIDIKQKLKEFALLKKIEIN